MSICGPVAASILVGVLLIGITWVFLLVTSVQGSFNDVVAVAGLLFAIFYILTALATIVYYRRRVFTSAWDAGKRAGRRRRQGRVAGRPWPVATGT